MKFSKNTIDEFVAPLSLRFGAMLLDYVLLLIPPIVALVIGRIFGLDGARLLDSWLVDISWFLSLCVFLLNQILFPVLTGQSFGKRLVGLRIIDLEGRIPELRAIALRNLLGYSLNVVSAGLTFIPAIGRSGRGIHDRISGTIVIRAKAS